MWITFPRAKRHSVTALAHPQVTSMSVHDLELPTRVIERPVTRSNLDDPQGCRIVRAPRANTYPVSLHVSLPISIRTLTKCSKIPHSLTHFPKCFPEHVDHISESKTTFSDRACSPASHLDVCPRP